LTIVDKEIAKSVSSIENVSDRILIVKLVTEPVCTVIIQVYLPTTDAEEEEVNALYEQIEDLLKRQRGRDNVIVMGDWNANVGEGKDEKEVGTFGLGKRNDRGEKLVEFCRKQKLIKEKRGM
jgi:exonuclease III